MNNVTYLKLIVLKISRENEAILKIDGESELKTEILKAITN